MVNPDEYDTDKIDDLLKGISSSSDEEISKKSRKKSNADESKSKDKSNSAKNAKSKSRPTKESDEGEDEDSGGGGGKEADIIIDIALNASKELFVDQYELPYAALKIAGRVENLGMGKKRFKSFLIGEYFDQAGTAPGPESVATAIAVLKARAAFKGKIRKLYERVAPEAIGRNFNILYDLTNPKWECVRITPAGWHVIADTPIIFRRHGNEQEQLYPVKKYPKDIFDQFMKLLNIKGDENKLLMKCYIVSLFIPEIQKPILMLHGEQGAAKSTLQEILKILIDPRSVRTLAFPGQQKEMVQQLYHHYVAFYDNISQIKEWISNILCRSVTGSGFSKRQLYTDDDDIVYNYKRAMGFNGINLAATKGDLLDRGLIILLDRLSETQQRNISEIWEGFYLIRQKVLGYIMDILVKVLAMGPTKLDKLPRMAEFAQWGETISQCMGNPKMAFTNAFKANRRLQAIQVIETSPVAMVLNEMMEGLIDDYQRGRTTIDSQKHFDEYIKPEENTWTWRGSPTDLLRQLTIQALNMGVNTKNKMWPGAPHVLSRRLTEVRATLKEIGIDIGFKTDVGREKRREINIVKIASPASPASPSKNPAQKGGKSGDATKEGDATSVSGKQVASLKMVKNEHENEGRDARDARDATFANNIYPSDTNTDNIEDTD